MLAFVAPPLAPYIPPLRLPPLRGPVTSPYRPPTTNRPPGTQPAPIYQPPDFLPPTGLDMKGEVCIFANTPIWEPKKIRYRYPGENWQEIAGEKYSLEITKNWNPLPMVMYEIQFTYRDWCWDTSRGEIKKFNMYSLGGFVLKSMPPGSIFGGQIEIPNVFPHHKLQSKSIELWDMNGARYGGWAFPAQYSSYPYAGIQGDCRAFLNANYAWVRASLQEAAKWNSVEIVRVIRFSDKQEISPKTQCIFTVFDVFDNLILSITRDECPEAFLVSEKCYFKPENERLVAKVFQSFLDPPLRIEYQGNCATVWKDSWPINYFPLMIYKECTDNPNCPPPRIRLDNKKCKEECRQCPTGTAIKVLSGGNIACVDAFGCIIKEIKFKPGCNNYDCICG